MSYSATLRQAILALIKGEGKPLSPKVIKAIGLKEGSIGVRLGVLPIPPRWTKGAGRALDRAWYGLTTVPGAPLDLPIKEQDESGRAIVAFQLRNRVPVYGYSVGDGKWECYVVADKDALAESQSLFKNPAALEKARQEYVNSRRRVCQTRLAEGNGKSVARKSGKAKAKSKAKAKAKK